MYTKRETSILALLVATDPVPFGSWLLHPTVVATAVGNFALGYLFYFFISTFPSYLVHEWSMDLSAMGMAASLPWLVGAVGVLLGGYVSDRLVWRLGDEVKARKIIIVVGFALAGICMALAPGFATSRSALALVSFAEFFICITSPNYSALARASVPGAVVACSTLVVAVLGSVSRPPLRA